MCGRDTQFYTWREIHAFSGGLAVSTPTQDPEPNYNRAPTQSGWVLVDDGAGGAIATQMRWGLLPPWAKDEKLAYSTINARAETASTKPAFRSAWKQRRGVIPSSGYYEWLKVGSTKQPYFIHAVDAPVVFFAGLWERRGELLTYSIVTREADPSIAFLHDRMPLMLPSDMLAEWIHGTPEQAGQIAIAAPEPDLIWHKVDRAVGNVRNRGAHLIEPVVG